VTESQVVLTSEISIMTSQLHAFSTVDAISGPIFTAGSTMLDSAVDASAARVEVTRHVGYDATFCGRSVSDGLVGWSCDQRAVAFVRVVSMASGVHASILAFDEDGDALFRSVCANGLDHALRRLSADLRPCLHAVLVHDGSSAALSLVQGAALDPVGHVCMDALDRFVSYELRALRDRSVALNRDAYFERARRGDMLASSTLAEEARLDLLAAVVTGGAMPPLL